MRLLLKTALFLFSTALGYFAAGCDGDDSADDGNGVVCDGDPSTGDSDGDGVCDSDDPCPLEMVWEGNYTITNAASVEALADYAVVTGSLMIDPDESQITGPACLERIDGDLTMQGSDIITELSGFDSLQEVGGHVAFSHNESLVTLDLADAPLVSVGRYVFILDNEQMVEVHLPPTLATVGGGFWFWSNHLIQSLALPDSVSVIQEDLRIESNSSLTVLTISSPSWEVGGDLTITGAPLETLDLGNGLDSVGGSITFGGLNEGTTTDFVLPDSLAFVGFDIHLYATGTESVHLPAGLQSIGGSLMFGNCHYLQVIDFASNLASIGGALVFYALDSVAQIALPDSLVEIGGGFSLSSNTSLTSISATGLDSVLVSFDVYDNPSLPTCQATALRDQLSDVGGVCIQNNAADTCEDDLSGC